MKYGLLKKEEKKIFYLYRQSSQSNIFEGIIAGCSVDDYLNGIIKVHEETITKREQMFTDYLNTTCFNADPILLSYKGEEEINSLIKSVTKNREEYNFTTTDKIQHQLWLIDSQKDINLICKSFEKINNIYIADGHHRAASSALLAKKRNEKKDGNSNYFMSFLIAENQLNIINFNRLIKNINDLSVPEFIEKIRNTFKVVASSFTEEKEVREIGMYLDGQYYLLRAKKGSYKNDCVNRLCTAILSNNILGPILGINDEKTDKNINFVSGNTSVEKIKESVDSGEFAVAFILNPISIEALKEVADKGKKMPPKSTYIEPKLRSGLTIYPIE